MGAEPRRPSITIVVPVHRGGEAFERCLAAIGAQELAPLEVIVVADGGLDQDVAAARRAGAGVAILPQRGGPARARNVGARLARGEILYFVDADVDLAFDSVARVAEVFAGEAAPAAVIGSYDDQPAGGTFLSQYRNLQHHYVHQSARAEASTFWGACGAIRKNVFHELGGFDETYCRPCIEDIELGYRLRRQGHAIRLCRQLQVKHLKIWTAGSLLRADFLYRAPPWTELILREGRAANDLNLHWTGRASGALAVGALGCLIASAAWAWLLAGVGLAAVGLIVLERGVLPVPVAASRGVVPAPDAAVALVLLLVQCGRLWPGRGPPRVGHSPRALASPGAGRFTCPGGWHVGGGMMGGLIAVLGAGPAGLAAAYELCRRGRQVVVYERDRQIGGLSRTESYKGCLIDLGGHRFYTRSDEIHRLWRDLLGDDLRKVVRLSRIYHDGRFLHYPLRPIETLRKLGALESALVLGSYLWGRCRPARRAEDFEQWAVARFGRRLYETFFRTYTEKLWGLPCREIAADWTDQRIGRLSLAKALSNALLGTNGAKSLIEEFDYPVRGPGMMWQRMRECIDAAGGRTELGSEAVRIEWGDRRVRRVTIRRGGADEQVQPDHVSTSIPLADLIARMDPAPPPAVVVNWNGRDDLERCLASLDAQDYPRDRLEILVIDNASTDGSVEACRAAHPRASWLVNQTNVGTPRRSTRASGADWSEASGTCTTRLTLPRASRGTRRTSATCPSRCSRGFATNWPNWEPGNSSSRARANRCCTTGWRT